MHDALKRLLKEALPRMVGGSVLVSEDALENGDTERFMVEARRKLSSMLAGFITDSKVLDGADASCFTMEPDHALAAQRCTVRLHVLTPKELEDLMQKAFNAGRSGRGGDAYMPSMHTPEWEKPAWLGEWLKLPTPKDMERIIREMELGGKFPGKKRS